MRLEKTNPTAPKSPHSELPRARTRPEKMSHAPPRAHALSGACQTSPTRAHAPTRLTRPKPCADVSMTSSDDVSMTSACHLTFDQRVADTRRAWAWSA